MNHKVKAVFGNHSFTKEEKDTPIYMDASNIGQFIYPDFGLDYSDLNYIYLSMDSLTVCSVEIRPGGFFNSPDYHPGDEAYFVLERVVTQFNPATGQCIEVKERETLLIPKGTLHSAYNFGEKAVKVLAVITPKIVESQKFPTDVNRTKRIFHYNRDEVPERIGGWDEPQAYGTVDYLGVWPAPGEALREKQLIYHAMEQKKLKVITGDTRPVLMRFTVSDDFLYMGEYIVSTGGVMARHPRILCHGSETFLLGVEGPMTVYLTDTRETYILKHYKGLYIPAGMRYQLINYDTVGARAVFAITRNL